VAERLCQTRVRAAPLRFGLPPAATALQAALTTRARIVPKPEPTAPAPAEGEVNRSPARQRWQDEHLDAPTRELLRRDAAAFLHQSLSTPCLNGIRRAQGIWIESVLQRLGYRQSCRGATVARCWPTCSA
jgi:hypothetical protein